MGNQSAKRVKILDEVKIKSLQFIIETQSTFSKFQADTITLLSSTNAELTRKEGIYSKQFNTLLEEYKKSLELLCEYVMHCQSGITPSSEDAFYEKSRILEEKVKELLLNE